MVRNNSQLNNSQSQALAENNSKFNIAVGFVPMFSVKCLMLNSWIIHDNS